MDIASLVNQFGLPIGLLLYFIWRDYQRSKEHMADMKEVAGNAVSAINASTETAKKSTEVAEKSDRTNERVVQVLERVERRLDGGT